MHQYEWDPETGGILLKPQQSKSSNEPRPVYYREMNLLGMDRRWTYPQNDDAPIMWAEAERYIYKGRVIAKTRGGSLYTAPEVIYTENEDGEPIGSTLDPVAVELMIEKNRELMNKLIDETAQKIYSTYKKFRKSIDIFYVAFSGGKDSVVALDMVQRTLPHNAFKVVFGDTQMEFPDTYKNVDTVEKWCKENEVEFLRAKSKLQPLPAWKAFGPPATEIRWCCSVFKTTPQILLLRSITGKPNFTGMAFTGVRGDESVSRSKYDDISEGKKHSGQFSYHVIFEWSSAEVFLHIMANKLPIGESYYLGIPRAGCLVCPNAIGRSDYFRRSAYTNEVDQYIDIIRTTSNKKDTFTDDQMADFIELGHWRTRRTGRELTFGKDKFQYEIINAGTHRFSIQSSGFLERWQKWLKTIGDVYYETENRIQILFEGKSYKLTLEEEKGDSIGITLSGCYKQKIDIKFLSLLRSSIIKAIYCVNCGVCEAECKNDCLHCSKSLEIGDNCRHCYQCHEIHERCVRYFSIRNKEKGDRPMGRIDRYASFGFRKSWLQSYVVHGGDIDFWISEADGLAPNKRQDACHQFMQDSEMIEGKWKNKKNPDTGDKEKDYSTILNKPLGEKVLELGADNAAIWAIAFVNLVSNSDVPTFRWFLQNCELFQPYDDKMLFEMLQPCFVNDEKGHGKQNVVDSLKIIFATSPLGQDRIIADIDYTTNEKNGNITLNSITRQPWYTPIPEVILYALYKFAEKCDYYQFTLSYLMDESIEREGISPTTIFGLDRETMIRLLNGLAMNYPDYISASFVMSLETITLQRDRHVEDILQLL